MTGDPYGPDYYRDNGQSGDRPALAWYARLVRRYCGPGPYLDYGCGTGHLLRRLAAHGNAAGFEVSAWSVAAARDTAPGATVYDDPAALPTAAFGALVAVHVLEHLDDDAVAAALATWRRVLVPGGRALVATPDPAGRGHAVSGPRWIGYEGEVAELLGIPAHVRQGVLLPTAYYTGETFRPAPREPLESVLHVDRW